ncbi:branched-chain amino acid ABC transporter permease [Mangrovitalea sediminis]|uniref:branched-chain amino acid ABC transporter permease n=1 Tax=Mangrovitalea sediminis TaxID=1982043 RepID=UPI000BE603B7|nr:branched-chain amino acid ABC transporter permease [Mangrovitalea sediminis]
MQLKHLIHWRSTLVLLALIVLILMPLGASGYVLGVLTVAFYLAVYAMSWDLLFGYAGEVNFGPTFLVGLGAYGAGLSNSVFSIPVWPSVAIGTFLALVGGLVLAGPALRLRGPYFGLVTLVAVILLEKMIGLFSSYTGGEIGLTIMDVLTISNVGNFYYALGFMVIAAIALRTVARSSIGLILEASGQDPVATEALGFNVTKYKLFAFALSALFSGMAGALMVFYLGSASPGTVVTVFVTIQIIIATIVGGRRTILGPILGAIFLIVAGEVLRPLGQLSNAVVALIALLLLLFAPNGFAGLFARSGGRA